MTELIMVGRPLPPLPSISSLPDWQQADPRWIGSALQKALALPGGGWFVVDSSDRFGEGPLRYPVAGRQLVFWRGKAGLMAAPDACPHMGASLAAGCVRDGQVICPWHGLPLGDKPMGGWRTVPVHDDGVLVWVRLDDCGESPSERPYLPVRPASFIAGVIRMEAACEAQDVVANRLDPWHGVHYHPHSFKRLRVVEQRDDEITVRVAYAAFGRYAVEVDARFHCPDPRCIVMTIVRGDGEGSVVETHAAPVGPGRSAVIEATLATSDRAGFRHVLGFARWIRPLIEKRAARLWVEDIAYAEQRYALRAAGGPR
jgi:isorenieratene synthase